MAIKFIFDSSLTIFVVTLNKVGSYNRKEELHSSAILLIFQFVPNAGQIRQQMLEIHHSADLSLFPMESGCFSLPGHEDGSQRKVERETSSQPKSCRIGG